MVKRRCTPAKLRSASRVVSVGTSSSSATAMVARQLSTLCRPGTRTSKWPSDSPRRRTAKRALSPSKVMSLAT